MLKKCGKSVLQYLVAPCVLEEGHPGDCTPACDEPVMGRYYRMTVLGNALLETCTLPKKHSGHCIDHLGKGPLPYLKEFSIFDGKLNTLTVYSRKGTIVSRTKIKEAQR